MKSQTLECDDLNEAIGRYTRELGYRLNMIMPADNPREALLSKDGETIRLLKSSEFQVPSSKLRMGSGLELGTLNLEPASGSEWTAGRAGMMYRDLIPGRLGGKIIASHIRIIDGGEVPDSVHYHKIDFQVIYCLKGAIKVVYEDQGEPFWLRPGDCVLQPPEIRHRVLGAEAGSEVIELTSPAEHETWFDHELELPTRKVSKDRMFSSQRFVRYVDDKNAKKSLDALGNLTVQTGFLYATAGKLDVRTFNGGHDSKEVFVFAQDGTIYLKIAVEDRGVTVLI